MFNDDKPLLNLISGESRTINVTGDYVHLLEADGAVSIVAEHTRGGYKTGSMKVEPNGGRRLDRSCNKWIITNLLAVTQSVLVSVGTGEILDPKFSIVADVNALTRFDNLTADGNQFFGGYSFPPSALQYHHFMLYNPAGSERVLRCDTKRLNAGGGDIWIGRHDDVTGFFDVTSTFASNKRLYGAAPSAQLFFRSDTVKVGTVGGVVGSDVNKTPTPFDFGESPIEIVEEKGLLVRTNIVNMSLSSWFEWSENV